MSTEAQAVNPGVAFVDEQRHRMVKSMRLVDLVLFGIATVVTLDSIGQISSYGAQAFTFLVLLIPLFVAPYAMLMAELSGSVAREGAPYFWMRMAFGRKWAGLGAVLYWITNPLWLGGSLCFLATQTFSSYIVGLNQGSFADYVFKLAFVWVGILVAIISLKRGKWIPSVGAIARILLIIFVCVTVVIYGSEHGVHGYGAGDFSPTIGGFLGIVPVLLFAISGFECGTAASDEMNNAKRDGPLYILRSTSISVICYMVPILAVLLVLPTDKITGLTGFMTAVTTIFSVYGSAAHAMVVAVGAVFIFTLLTQGAAWMMGSDRVVAVAAMDGTFPRWFGVFNRRFGTPVRVNMFSGLTATIFVIVGQNLTSGSAGTSFVIVLTVAISTVLMSYIIIYPTAIVLRRKFPELPRPFLVPGGRWGMIGATVLATFFAILGSWVALFPDTLEPIFGVKYNFLSTWGVSRGHFELLTLGTVAVIVVLTGVGLVIGSAERRREGVADDDMADIAAIEHELEAAVSSA